MSNPKKQPHEEENPGVPQDEVSSLGTQISQASEKESLPLTINEGLTTREREELLMQHYLVNHPELFQDYSQQFSYASKEHPLDHDHQPLTFGVSSKAGLLEGIPEEEEKQKQEVFPFKTQNDDIDPFEDFDEKQTVKNMQFQKKEKTLKIKQIRAKPTPKVQSSQIKQKYVKHWSIDRIFVSNKAEKKQQQVDKDTDEPKQCQSCPLAPISRKIKKDTAQVEYQTYMNPHLEHWETSEDNKVYFDRLVAIKEYDSDSTPSNINHEPVQYQPLQLSIYPPFYGEVIEKQQKVLVKTIKEEEKKLIKEESQEEDIGGAFEDNIYFCISDDDDSISDVPSLDDQFI